MARPPAGETPRPGRPRYSHRGALRRWGPWLLIAVVVLVAGFAGLHRPGHPGLDQRTLSLAGQVRCPVCNGQSVAQSDAPPSLAIRNQIHAELAAGAAPDQVLAGIVNSYGPGILEQPRVRGIGLLVWVVPIVGVLGAVAGLSVAFRRWRPSTSHGAVPTATDRDLVDSALRASAPEKPSS